MSILDVYVPGAHQGFLGIVTCVAGAESGHVQGAREAESDCDHSPLQRSLCESERARVWAAQKHPVVWTPRRSPPTDWHLPLPQDKDG